MALVHNTNSIVLNGLVLALDAANSKSFDSAENLLTYSEQFDNAAWGTQFSTVTANSVASPNGTTTADTFTASSSAAFVYRELSASTQTYTFSCFAKAGTATSFRLDFVTASYTLGGSCIFDLSAGTAGTVTLYGSSTGFTATIQNFSNGWYRCSISGTSTATTWYAQIALVNNSGNNIYIWGAQLETGSSPASSYYATTGTIKTRGNTWSDLSGNGRTGTLVGGPTYSSLYGGSFVFNGSSQYATTTPSFSYSANSPISISCIFNASALFVSGFSIRILNFTNNSGILLSATSVGWYNSGAGLIAPVNISTGTWYVVHYVYSGSQHLIYLNGILGNTETSSSSAISSGLYIGKYFGSNDAYFNGRISQISIYNRALSAAEVSQNYNALKSRYV